MPPFPPEGWKMLHREESEHTEPFTCPNCGEELPVLELASAPGDHPSGVAELQCACQCGTMWLEVVTWDKTMVKRSFTK